MKSRKKLSGFLLMLAVVMAAKWFPQFLSVLVLQEAKKADRGEQRR